LTSKKFQISNDLAYQINGQDQMRTEESDAQGQVVTGIRHEGWDVTQDLKKG
jgi:hypothetical protein